MLIPEVKRAAEIVGGVSALCDRLRLTRSALHQWERVPRGRVLELEEVTGGQVTRQQMRPDLYPAETAAEA